MGGALHRLQARGRAAVTRSSPGSGARATARPLDVRVGSDDGRPDAALRSRSARSPRSAAQWLGARRDRAGRGRRRPADEARRHARSCASTRALHVLGPFWIHHVRNSGIAFGLFASATAIVIVLTGGAVGWMLAYFARSGARHPVLPVALGLVIGGSVSNLRRPRPPRLRDRLPRPPLLAGVQPRRQLHRRRRRHPARGARRRRPRAAPSAPPRRDASPCPRRGGRDVRLDRFLARRCRRSAPARGRRRACSRAASLVDGRPRGRRATGSRAGRTLEFEPPQAPHARARAGAARRSASSTRTSTCSSSTSPPGSSSIPAPGHASGNARARACSRAGAEGGEDQDRPGIVHRLDRDTSGLLVVARSEEAHRRLQALVPPRALTREYLALVAGRPRSRRGTIEAPIGRDRHDRLRHSLDTETPREAVTHFEVEELLRRTRAPARPAGDGADAPDPRPSRRDRPARRRRPALRQSGETSGSQRQFLHAARLAFAHPFTGEPVDVVSPLPEDLAAALARARG